VGLDRADDAGVYKVTDDIAIIQTVDFFTPIVDDPYWFGQIAAANALSDVYAMGGVPKTAMNLVAFPLKEMEMAVLRHIIQGGLDKLREADVVLLGGHSVEDSELKYGLSVTGFIHPDRVLTKGGLQEGDRLILTKPLGTGIINTAIKGGLASEEIIDTVTRLMATLNREAADVMNLYPVHACTDITGFGLIGHLAEMIVDAGIGIRLKSEKIPIIPEALEYARIGLVPAGTYNNREFRESITEFAPSVDRLTQDVLFDPQTSGGLLICVDREKADSLLHDLKKKGVEKAAVIGEVISGTGETIVVD
jgi:selenide,water dikinase